MIPITLPIAKPPWKKRGKRLESSIRKALYEFKMLEKISKLGIALSGGKGSLSLLFFLHAISGHGFPKFDLFAIHVGGEFSCGAGVEENFLKAVCQQLNVTFLQERSTQKKESLRCYRCSRERRRLIFEAAKRAQIDTVAFGHHRDDNAQTLLMNLLHKGEFAGNLPKIPMVDFGVTIIRPLIYVAEEDLRQFAKEYGFNRVVCQCPVGRSSMRKQVDDLLTELEATFPNARANVARASLLYGSDKAIRRPT